MITRSQVQTVATRSRFRPEPVEKVLRLIEILRRLDRHEVTSSAWVLKGGTALNLFHLDAPRLSVDVDINFVGVEDVQALPQARESFERALVSCCERAGCAVKRAPAEHAGGKFRLRFASVLGGTQNLEVDVLQGFQDARLLSYRNSCSILTRCPGSHAFQLSALTPGYLCRPKTTQASLFLSQAHCVFPARLRCRRPVLSRGPGSAGHPCRWRIENRAECDLSHGSAIRAAAKVPPPPTPPHSADR